MGTDVYSKKNTIIKGTMLAGVLALLLCAYQSCVMFGCDVSGMAADAFGIRRFVEFLLFFEALILFCVIVGNEKLFKYRYLIATSCFIICVALEITGSSIGCLIGGEEKNLLLGVSRPIRSDEWALLTPMTWTQYLDPNGAFSYFNSVIRAESTDVFLEYGLPVYTPLMIYKPFLIGYLFLPIAKGMAFFWCGRLIALAMVSFEFGRFITKDNRPLSLVYSVMIVFSPVVQWWFAINGFVEMLIFFQLSLICFDKYLRDDNPKTRLMNVVIIGICTGGYALTMYPAWMIPLAYLLLACIIWVFYKNYKEGAIKRLCKIDFVPIIFVLCMLTLSALYIYNNSQETIRTIANTIYPGHRIDYGGSGQVNEVFSFIPSLWYAARDAKYDTGVNNNVCECASFVCMFPAPYLLYFHRIMKKRRDALCTLMVIVSILLMIYVVMGVPKIVADITFLKFSFSRRTIIVADFANVILLIRLMALNSEDKEEIGMNEGSNHRVMKSLLLYLLMCASAIWGIWATYRLNTDYFNKYMIVIEALFFIPLYCLLCSQSKKARYTWALLMVAVCLISGALANPVRMGVDDINKSSDVQMIRQIVEKDPEAIWISEGPDFCTKHIPLLAGARTINCANIYPDLERWRAFDPKGIYEECYNRYVSYLIINKKNEDIEGQKFVLVNELTYIVNLSDKEMKALGTKYIFSENNLNGDNLELIASNGSHNVYVLY